VAWPERKVFDSEPKESLLRHGIKEEEEGESDSDDSNLEWGVQENMKLFEVSAKDDQGERNPELYIGIRVLVLPQEYKNSSSISFGASSPSEALSREKEYSAKGTASISPVTFPVQAGQG
jgi:hypothetical protein